jgi:23S rRNA pseudouridine1911/1915/1917 synthase
VGDPVYAGGGARRIGGAARALADRLERVTPRQALHAAGLGFRHPATGEPLQFSAPWPADLAEALTVLGGPDLLAHAEPLRYLGFFNRDA